MIPYYPADVVFFYMGRSVRRLFIKDAGLPESMATSLREWSGRWIEVRRAMEHLGYNVTNMCKAAGVTA